MTVTNNKLMTICPYLHDGEWVFDDAETGLVREPFVLGIDEMIDQMVSEMPESGEGFTLIFSSEPFPGFSRQLTWMREEYGGNWYWSNQDNFEGWLCPALLLYFGSPPTNLYLTAKTLKRV